MPFTRGTRYPILAARRVIKYLLRATFDAPDQGYANAQVLNTVDEGIQDGQLTVVEVDGTLAIVGNKCAFTTQMTPVWGDLGFYSQAITRALGQGLLGTANLGATNKSLLLGWADNGGVALADLIYSIDLVITASVDVIVWDGAGTPFENLATISTFSAATDYQLSIILGGYDVNGVPWRSGQAATSYLYGAAFFIKGGAFTNWTLLWRTALGNTATLYAAMANYNAASTIDYFRVPDADLSAVLQPVALSTFTAVNGTSLDAITPEVGGAWTEQAGNWDIQSNRVELTETASTKQTTILTGISDFIAGVVVRRDGSATSTQHGLTCRWTDADNNWRITALQDGTFIIAERNAAITTNRASGAVTFNADTDYDMRGIFDGQTIDAFWEGGNKLSYGSAALNENVTTHGLTFYQLDSSNDCKADNFVIYPRTSAVYDSVLGAV